MKNWLTGGLGMVGAILILNTIFTWVLVRKNNGEKYLETYLSQQQQVKIFVSDEYFEGKYGSNRYLKKIIFYRGIFRGSENYTFIDNYSNKYFKIMRFDKYAEGAMRIRQRYEIENQELYVMVDSVQYNDPTYGTLENPYVVFSYRGVGKKLMMTINDLENKGEDGRYPKKEVPLAPSEEEYRYNAEQYLTYVMPKEEFKKRFEE